VEDIDVIRKLALNGDADAQYSLGRLYYGGKNASGDQEDAKVWYELAAEQGDAYKQYYIGMHNRGPGVPKDDEEAAKWWRLAAEQGHADSQYGLGMMYMEGCGVEKDPDEAEKWLRLAAAHGNGDAEKELRERLIL